jgi:hypothetical protein
MASAPDQQQQQLASVAPLPPAPVRDFPHPVPVVRHENDYVPKYTPVRMIIAGASNCGKSVLMYNMVFTYDLFNSDHIHIMAKTLDQPLYVQLIGLVDTTPEYQGKIEFHDELIPIDDLNLDPTEKNLAIIDDFVENVEDPILKAYIFRSRHKNCDVVILTQGIYIVPNCYRRNINMMALFKGSCNSRTTRQCLWRDHFTDIPFELFDKWYMQYVMADQSTTANKKRKNATGGSSLSDSQQQQGGHDFLLIDFETTDRFRKYRHGLSDFLPVPSSIVEQQQQQQQQQED